MKTWLEKSFKQNTRLTHTKKHNFHTLFIVAFFSNFHKFGEVDSIYAIVDGVNTNPKANFLSSFFQITKPPMYVTILRDSWVEFDASYDLVH